MTVPRAKRSQSLRVHRDGGPARPRRGNSVTLQRADCSLSEVRLRPGTVRAEASYDRRTPLP